jgi:hypothetical protein
MISSLITSSRRYLRLLQALGIFHVLTGPDHLSALATLSANVGNCQAFYLGVRWGLGHSTGLLLVGVVLIFLTLGNDDDPVEVPHGVTKFFESLVGVFMIGLGVYGIRRALEKRRKEVYGNVEEVQQPDSTSTQEEGDIESVCAQEVLVPNSASTQEEDDIESVFAQEVPDSDSPSMQEDDVEIPVISDSYHDHVGSEQALPLQTIPSDNGETETSELDPALPEHVGVEDDSDTGNQRCNLVQNVSTKTMAIWVGIIHGLAGPGGVLGVIPAVQLHDLKLATIYLGCFCISSTFTMGIFAATYGILSAKLGQGTQRGFQIECVSASLSILVGIVWLTLLSIGKLDDLFP